MRISHHTQLTSAEKSPWCRRSRVSPDLVEYGTSWSPRCRAITVTWSEISVRAVKGQSARSQRHSMLCCQGTRATPEPLPYTGLGVHLLPSSGELHCWELHGGPWAADVSGLGLRGDCV